MNMCSLLFQIFMKKKSFGLVSPHFPMHCSRSDSIHPQKRFMVHRYVFTATAAFLMLPNTIALWCALWIIFFATNKQHRSHSIGSTKDYLFSWKYQGKEKILRIITKNRHKHVTASDEWVFLDVMCAYVMKPEIEFSSGKEKKPARAIWTIDWNETVIDHFGAFKLIEMMKKISENIHLFVHFTKT